MEEEKEIDKEVDQLPWCSSNNNSSNSRNSSSYLAKMRPLSDDMYTDTTFVLFDNPLDVTTEQ